MKTELPKNRTLNSNKSQSALSEINAKIEALNQERLGLIEPQKTRFLELRAELMEIENQIRELDPSWRPAPLKARAEVKITELITAKGPLAADEIYKELKGIYTKWKIKKTLSDKSEGEKAVFAVSADGKYSMKTSAV